MTTIAFSPVAVSYTKRGPRIFLNGRRLKCYLQLRTQRSVFKKSARDFEKANAAALLILSGKIRPEEKERYMEWLMNHSTESYMSDIAYALLMARMVYEIPQIIKLQAAVKDEKRRLDIIKNGSVFLEAEGIEFSQVIKALKAGADALFLNVARVMDHINIHGKRQLSENVLVDLLWTLHIASLQAGSLLQFEIYAPLITKFDNKIRLIKQFMSVQTVIQDLLKYFVVGENRPVKEIVQDGLNIIYKLGKQLDTALVNHVMELIIRPKWGAGLAQSVFDGLRKSGLPEALGVPARAFLFNKIINELRAGEAKSKT